MADSDTSCWGGIETFPDEGERDGFVTRVETTLGFPERPRLESPALSDVIEESGGFRDTLQAARERLASAGTMAPGTLLEER